MNFIIANRIYNLVSNDPAKIAILNLLADGKWHTRFEVESLARGIRPTIGFVGICTIIRALQNTDSELLEVYDNDSGRFYRLNPHRTELVKTIISYQKKTSKDPTTTSSSEFQKFKEILRQNRKNEKDVDEEMKQFL